MARFPRWGGEAGGKNGRTRSQLDHLPPLLQERTAKGFVADDFNEIIVSRRGPGDPEGTEPPVKIKIASVEVLR